MDQIKPELMLKDGKPASSGQQIVPGLVDITTNVLRKPATYLAGRRHVNSWAVFEKYWAEPCWAVPCTGNWNRSGRHLPAGMARQGHTGFARSRILVWRTG